jgi:hypothetical protein
VNRSSLATLYGSRLGSAYLGATNSERTALRAQGLGFVEDQDDMALSDYRPWEHGGPLHLVNVTLNETEAGRSQVVMRDRKGMGMAIGPAGVSVGVRHHAVWAPDDARALIPTVEPVSTEARPVFRVFPSGNPGDNRIVPRWPSLGRWVAISGAAVSTGMGAQTSLGLSLLAGLLNARLGHWWDSGISSRARDETSRPSDMGRLGAFFARLFSTQAQLMSELLGRFPGTSRRHWYLTDGGHFENTGLYELIRRRVPFIIFCDNGEDEERHFADLGNLVRKARTDFDADVRFLEGSDLDAVLDGQQRKVIGSLREMGFGEVASGVPAASCSEAAAKPTKYAALARVSYSDPDAVSLLLMLRPAVLGTEPADVLNYHADNPAFPDQSTLNQFFGEAQWEAYRRLGECMAKQVLGTLKQPETRPGAGWKPYVGEGKTAKLSRVV